MVINTVHSINTHKWHVNVAKVAFIAKGCFDPLQLLQFPASLNTEIYCIPNSKQLRFSIL